MTVFSAIACFRSRLDRKQNRIAMQQAAQHDRITQNRALSQADMKVIIEGPVIPTPPYYDWEDIEMT